jgi:hypothetical protein
MSMTFRVELAWQEEGADGQSGGERSAMFLTKDGRVVLQGQAVTEADRAALDLPKDAALISVDRALIKAIKDML